MTRMLSYLVPVLSSRNVGNFVMKSKDIDIYSFSGVGNGRSSPYSLCLAILALI